MSVYAARYRRRASVVLLEKSSWLLYRMRMLLIVLPQQVLAVVVAIRCSDHGVDMRRVRDTRSHQVAKRDRLLMVELDEDDGTVDAVVEDVPRFGIADPCQPGAIH